MNKPTGILPTKFGNVEWHLPSDKFVLMESEDRCVVNGVQYTFTFRMVFKDCTWKHEDWHEPYLRRCGSYDDPTQNAREAVRNTLTKAWCDFISENTDILHNAAIYDAEQAIERQENRVAEAAAILEQEIKELKLRKNILAALV